MKHLRAGVGALGLVFALLDAACSVWVDGSALDANNPDNDVQSVAVAGDVTPPVIVLHAPAQGSTVAGPVILTVDVTDASDFTATMRVNGTPFTGSITLAAHGEYYVEVVATDDANNYASLARVFQIDATGPTLTVVDPWGPTVVVRSSPMPVAATASDSTGVRDVVVNGLPLLTDAFGVYRGNVPLVVGDNTLTFVATDVLGNTFTATRQVTWNNDGGSSSLAVTITEPLANFVVPGGAMRVAGRLDGGTAPFQVMVQGAAAVVSGSDFSAQVPAGNDGTQTIVVDATDAVGAHVVVEWPVEVDTLAPLLTVQAPTELATVNDSAIVVQGVVSDAHLSTVTVNANPIVVVAGEFAAPVSLHAGRNLIEVQAVDIVGNRSVVQRQVVYAPSVPLLQVVAPANNSEVNADRVEVRFSVQASAALLRTDVVNTGGSAVTAALVDGVYAATVPLVPGDNVLQVVVEDALAHVVTSTVTVRYRDLSASPLGVSLLSPVVRTDVEPDALVVLGLDKPTDTSLSTAALLTHIALRVDGNAVPFGVSLSQDGQSITVVPDVRLPEKSHVSLTVEGLPAATGVGQREPFSAALTVRPPLTGIAGVVLDEDLAPIARARVALQATTSAGAPVGEVFTTTTGVDGNWALLDVPPGFYRADIEAVAEASPLSRVRPAVAAVAERVTTVSPHVLVVLDQNSAQFVDASAPLDVTFVGDSAGLRITTAQARAFAFADGSTRGVVTATPLSVNSLAYPMDGRIGTPLLWTIAPRGLTLTAPAQVHLPNELMLPVGRRVVVYALNDVVARVQPIGLGTVTADGTVAFDAPYVGVLDVVGYQPLTEAQEALVVAAQSGSGTGTQQGMLDEVNAPQRDMLASVLAWLVPSAHAQFLATSPVGLDAVMQQGDAANLSGRVEFARRDASGVSDDNNAVDQWSGVGIADVLVQESSIGQARVTGASGGFGFVVPTFGGDVESVVTATLPLGTFPVPRVDATGQTRIELVQSRMYVRSEPMALSTDATAFARVMVDAHVLRGTVRFVDRQGVPLPAAVAGAATTYDDKHAVVQVAPTDVDSTEVHFFKANQLDRAIARYALVGHSNDATGAHGTFARLRFGPRDLSQSERRRQGQDTDARVLREGDDVVVFAINHATGHAGLTHVKVPAYDAAANSGVLEINTAIDLYPPEIEVRVARAVNPSGVDQNLLHSLVRASGAATDNDRFLRVATRWRVRTAPTSAGHAASNADAGVLLSDRGSDAGPAALIDEGEPGTLLERLCAELGPEATAPERAACLLDERTLSDVPAGVPPLAGRVVHLSSVATTDVGFAVPAGAQQQVLHVATQTASTTKLPMDLGYHLIHVVGRPLLHADRDNDGTLTLDELLPGSGIVPRDAVLVAGAPDFRDGAAERGLPARAVAQKAIYDARLQTEAGDVVTVPAYDVTREHRFRVVGVDQEVVRADDGLGHQRTLPPDDPTVQASPEDDAYLLSLLLNDAEADARTGGRHDYEVRLGNDARGVDCTMTQSGASLVANCDDALLPELLSAMDVVYLELFESSNTSNVLSRFNFFGLSGRVDHVGHTGLATGDRATQVFGAQQTRANGAPLSRLNEAVFAATSPGIGEVRVDGVAVRRFDVVREAGLLVVRGRDDDAWSAPVTTISSTRDLAYGSVQLPASAADVTRGAVPPRIDVHVQPLSGEATTVALGQARGSIQSRSVAAPLHVQMQGVDVVDGRLSFTDVDVDVPDRGNRLVFSHTYNNQNNELTPVGMGFTHNHLGFVDEESALQGTAPIMRLAMVLGGQQVLFPLCDVGVVPSQCASDGSVDATLTVQRAAPLEVVVEDHGTGVVYTFAQPAAGLSQVGRRRVWLTSVDDQRGVLQYTYAPDSNNLTRVARVGGVLSLELSYDAIDVRDPAINAHVAGQVAITGLSRLARVEARSGTTVVDRVVFTHDTRDLLLRQVDKPMRAPAPSWRYQYASVPTGLSVADQHLLKNEIERREWVTVFGGVLGQWQYTRSASTSLPAHLLRGEVVTSVQAPGADAPWRLTFVDHDTRHITRPDGVVQALSLSTFGAPAATTVAGTTTSNVYENDNDTADLSTAKRALPQTTQDLDGTRVARTFQAPRHRSTQETVVPGSTSPLVPAFGNSIVTDVQARDARSGQVTQATTTGAMGLPLPIVATVNRGLVDAVSLAGGAVGVSLSHDATGLPLSGTDAQGCSVVFSGEDPVFGQRTQVTTTCATSVRTEVLGYDDLGRLVDTHVQETGAHTQLVLDGLGRVTTQEQAGTPNVTTSVRYDHQADGSGSITTTVGGLVREVVTTDVHQRVVTRRWPQQMGVEEVETTTYTLNRPTTIARTLRGSVVTLVYDARGDVASSTEVIGDQRTRTVWTRDARGNVLSREDTDAKGHVTTTSFDTLGHPARIDYGGDGTDAGRDVVVLSHDVHGHLITQTEGTHAWRQVYDAIGRVTERHSGDGVWSEVLNHDGVGRLTTSSSTPSDLAESFVYDAHGRLTQSTRTIATVDEAGAAQTLTATDDRVYDDATHTMTRTITSTTGVDGAPRTTTSTVTTDALGREVQTTQTLPDDAQHVVRTAYSADLLTQTVTDDATGLVTTQRFDRQGHLLSTETAEMTITQVIDSAGVLRERTTMGPGTATWIERFDAFGAPIERTLVATEALPAMTTTWRYPGGGVEVETPPLAAAISRVTNARGLVLSEAQGPRTSTFTYDGGKLASAKQQEGQNTTTITVATDDAGRERQAQLNWVLGNDTETEQRSHAHIGRTDTVTTSWSTTINGRTSTRSRSTTALVDSLGNVVRQAAGSVVQLSVADASGQPLFAGANHAALTRYQVTQGLVLSETTSAETTQYHYDRGQRVDLVTDTLGHTTTNTYTAMGVPQTRVVDGFVLSTEVFDAAGHPHQRTIGDSTWTTTSGPLGEVLRSELPTGDAYVFGYDADRQLTSLTSPGGVPQTWQYSDALRRLTQRTRGSSRWATSYDTNGTATTTTPLGYTQTEVTDAQGRAVSTTYTGAPGLERVDVAYAGEQPLFAREQGADTGDVMTTFGFDAANRLTRIARTGAPEIGYAYVDNVGSQTITRTINAATQTQTTDGLGRVVNVRGALGNVDIAYLSGGRLKSITTPTLTEIRDYDDRERVSTITLPGTTTSYGYDARGNRTHETVNGQSTTYAYDAADRLTHVRYPDGTAEAYALRGDGARTARKRFANYPTAFVPFTTEVVGATLQAHEQWGFNTSDGLSSLTDVVTGAVQPITTDADGRVVQSGTRIFNWDVAGRLRSTTDAGVQSVYMYDFTNRRIRTQDTQEDRQYLWGQEGVEAEGTTNLLEHTRAAGLSLGVGGVAFGHDALGSVVNRNGAGQRFDVWGKAQQPLPTTDRVGFTGHANEPTGLVYAEQRWLDTSTGRFLSLDPFAGDANAPLSTQGFAYAHANPTRFTDPTGAFAFLPAAAIAAIKLVAVITAVGAVGGAVVGASSTAYVNDDATALGILSGAGSGALHGAGGGLLIGTAIVAAPAAVAAATGVTVSTTAVATGVGVGGAGLAIVDASAMQYVARSGEHWDEGLVREANVATAVAAVGATLGVAKVNAVLDATLGSAVDGGLRAVANDSALAAFGQAPLRVAPSQATVALTVRPSILVKRDAPAPDPSKYWVENGYPRGYPTQGRKKMDMARIQSYSEIMAGKVDGQTWDWFRPGGEPIIIDTRGAIMAGHHRIAAAYRAGVEIPAGAITKYNMAGIMETRFWGDVLPRPPGAPPSSSMSIR